MGHLQIKIQVITEDLRLLLTFALALLASSFLHTHTGVKGFDTPANHYWEFTGIDPAVPQHFHQTSFMIKRLLLFGLRLH